MPQALQFSTRGTSVHIHIHIRWKTWWDNWKSFLTFLKLLDISVTYEMWVRFDTSESVQFSHSVVSDSLWPHESQHARPPCRSPTPRVHSNSYPLSRWCHPAISFSVVPFSSCPQSLPASESFPRVNPSYVVAKVLEFQLQHQSFQWTPRTDLL